MQRVFDVAVSVTALLVLSPLLAFIALALKLTSAGPVLYRGARVGRNGVPFAIFKFRTMRVGTGPAITRGADPRITPFGRHLRRWKLDELPQLLNVMRGDMSLAGPRPEAPEYVALYGEDERRVLRVRPGITSPASLQFRDEESMLHGDDWHERYAGVIMREKLRIDLAWLERRTFVSDIALLIRSALVVFTSRRDRDTDAEARP